MKNYKEKNLFNQCSSKYNAKISSGKNKNIFLTKIICILCSVALVFGLVSYDSLAYAASKVDVQLQIQSSDNSTEPASSEVSENSTDTDALPQNDTQNDIDSDASNNIDNNSIDATLALPSGQATDNSNPSNDQNAFYAVFNGEQEGSTPASTLSFYYDQSIQSHKKETNTIYEDLPTKASDLNHWPYDNIRGDIKNILIDKNVKNYDGLNSTAYMFSNMGFAENISGCEYINTINVKSMISMFGYFGRASKHLSAVPDVSHWNTSNVVNMSYMFSEYGFSSDSIAYAPDVLAWDTSKVINMSNMFSGYAYSCKNIDDVPNVSQWNTGKVENMSEMFSYYAPSSTSTLNPLFLSGWSIKSLKYCDKMFCGYGSSSMPYVDYPVIYATDWSKTKSSGVIAEDMFKDSKLKGNTNGGWASANTSENGCFTKLDAKTEFYAVFNTEPEDARDSNTLSFYYDKNKESHRRSSSIIYDSLPITASSVDQWSYNNIREDVEKVVIDNSVINYQDLQSTAYMFSNMFNSDNIVGCEYINTSNVKNMSHMFESFANSSETIKTVPDVSNWNTSNVTDMSYVFNEFASGSSSAVGVPDVSSWNTGNVTNMSYMFASYAQNTYGVPDVSKWDTSNVNDVSGIFYKYAHTNKNFIYVPDVSKWNTSKIKDVSHMFDQYAVNSENTLEDLNLVEWKIDSLTSAKSMFDSYNEKNSEGMSVVYSTDWSDQKKDVDADNMFANSKLKGDTTGNWSSANTSDNGCFSKEIEFYAVFNTSSETGKDSNTLSFYYDQSKTLRQGTRFEDLPIDASTAGDWGYDNIRGSVENVYIDDSVINYKELKSTAYMFYQMDLAKNIYGCENIDTYKVKSMSYMFYMFAYRTNHSFNIVPKVTQWNTSNVVDMSYLFYQYAYSSTVITAVPDVSLWDTSKVKDMSNMFYEYAYKSSSIKAVPNVYLWETSNVENMDGMFNCYAYSSSSTLNSLYLSSWNINSLSRCNRMFYRYAYSNSKDNFPIIYSTDWSDKKKDVDAENMFTESKLKGDTTGNWKSANTSDGCFTKKDDANEFYAVFNREKEDKKDAYTLSLYYDARKESHKKSTNYIYDNLPANATQSSDWTYSEKSNDVKKVFIDEGLKNYKDLKSTAYMFSSMTNAEYIGGCENLDTSNVTNMEGMFSSFGFNVSGIKNVPNVSNWNTSNVTNLSHMFTNYASSSTNIDKVPDVSNWDTQCVEDMSCMFSEYAHSSENINSIPDVSHWKTYKLSNISEMFQSYAYSSKDIASVPNVSGWTTGSVYDMSSMFNKYGYSSTKLGDVPNVSEWKTSAVKDVSFMFSSYAYKSDSLITVPDVEKWVTDNLENMSHMFDNYAYSSASISDVPEFFWWNTENVSNMSHMFSNFAYLSTILNDVPNVSAWKTKNVYDMSYMFSNFAHSSTNINYVPNVEKWNTGNVKNMDELFCGYAHSSNKTLQSLDLSNWNINSLEQADKMFYEYAWSSAKGNPIVYANNWCTKKPDGVSATNMFKSSALKGNTDGDWESANISDTGCFIKKDDPYEFYAVYNTNQETGKDSNILSFYYDQSRSLREGVSYDLPNRAYNDYDWGYHEKRNEILNIFIDENVYNYKGLISTAYMFSDMGNAECLVECNNLDTSNVTNMSYMFKNYGFDSKNIASVPNVSNWNTSSVRFLTGMFECYALNSDKITSVPDVSKWDTSSVEDMSKMFNSYAYTSKNNSSVPNVSKWDTSKVRNMSDMFKCFSYNSTVDLKPLDLLDWNIDNLTWSKKMFYGYAHSNSKGSPIVYSSDWTKQKSDVEAEGMFDLSKLKGNTEGDWASANISDDGCFTDAPFEFYAESNNAGDEFNSAKTLNFYYDQNRRFRQGTTYDLPTDAKSAQDWGYNNIRTNVQTVSIDKSVYDYKALNSTAYMFSDMNNVKSIAGFEYIDTSNVTNMSHMFAGFAYNVADFVSVPDVSKWDTSRVENMSSVFLAYAASSVKINSVPDVSKWNTNNVKNMDGLFSYYAYSSTTTLQALNLYGWSINSLENTVKMFYDYAGSNAKGGPIVYATDWSKQKSNVSADNMFTNSRLKGDINGNWASANTFASGCFTDSPPEFYAVYNAQQESSALSYVLSFYYDQSKSLHQGTTYDLPTDAKSAQDWGYDNIRTDILNVEIDKSVNNFKALNSTAYMFSGMVNAVDITGCEYIDTSNVKNMSHMFASFAFESSNFSAVPDVSSWKTNNVEDMSSIFEYYAKSSEIIADVPNVSQWDTSKVVNMSHMFVGFAFASKSLELVPEVSNWHTGNVEDMSYMFSGYGSENITITPDVSKWDTSNVEDMSYMFSLYSSANTKITAVPDLSSWNVSNLNNAEGMFNFYACNSKNTLQSLDLSSWDIASLSNAKKMFMNYAYANSLENRPIVYASDWSQQKPTEVSATDMFKDSRLKGNTNGGWASANTYDSGCFSKKDDANEFYAVYYDTQETSPLEHVLSFYYDQSKNIRQDTTYDLPTDAKSPQDWGYNDIRKDVHNIVIDKSVYDYKALNSTAYMFSDMVDAADIAGCEYIDTSKVKNMSHMFASFASDKYNFSVVPDVSSWNTSKVEDMSFMFYFYASKSKKSLQSLDLSSWKISLLLNTEKMFSNYASSNSSEDIPIVYATNWSDQKTSGISAENMFTDSKLKGNTNGDWSSANTSSTGCFTSKKLEPQVSDLTFYEPDSLVFDGDEKEASFSGKDGMGSITVKYSTSLETGGWSETAPSDAGQYYVMASISEGSIYKAKDLTSDSWQFTISKAKVELPNAKTGLVFNEKSQTGVVQLLGAKYTLEGNEEINAGDYSATATLTDKTNYEWDLATPTSDDQSIPWSIAKAKIKVPSPYIGLVYNESEQTGVVLPDGAKYTLDNNTAIHAGKYVATARLDDKDNYEWNLATPTSDAQKISWSISKARPTISGLSCSDVVYGESPQPHALSDYGDITYSYSDDEKGEYGQWKLDNDPGIYWVKAFVDDTDDWYSAESLPISFTVNEKYGITVKAFPPLGLIYNGFDQSLGYIKTEPSDCSVEYSVNGETVPGAPAAADAGSYTIGYKASKKGYSDVIGSFTAKITKADPELKLDPSSNDYTVPTARSFKYSYNGDGEISVTSSNENVASATIDQSTVIVTPLSGGTATITVNASEGRNYKAGKAEHLATVNSGTINVEPHPATDLIYTGSVQNLGNVTADVDGCTIEYKVNGESIAGEPQAIDASTYIVDYKVSKTGYKTEEDHFEVTISKAKIKSPSPVIGLIYNGSEQTGVVLPKDAKYTLKGNIAINAGKHNAIAALIDKNNYEWAQTSTSEDLTVEWSISKARPNISDFVCSNVVYGEFPAPSASTDFGEVTYSYSNTKEGEYIGWDINNQPGTYWVKASVAATENWIDSEASPIEFSVNKNAIIVNTHPFIGLIYNGSAQKLGYVTCDPSDCSIEYKVDGGQSCVSPTATEAGKHSIQYKVSKNGYTDVVGSFTANIVKAHPVLMLDASSAEYSVPKSDTFKFSYNGDGAISVSSSDSSIATATVDQSTVTVTPLSGGTATITVNAAEGKNFIAAKAQHSATVNEGTIKVDPHPVSDLIYTGSSQKLGYVTADPSDCIIEYRVDEGAYSPAEPYATNARKHIVGYKVSKTGYTTIEKTFEVTIAKADVLVPDPVVDLVYNGSEQIGVESSQDFKYTLSNNKATDASDYIAVAHLVDGENYEWNLSPTTSDDQNISWSIAKATPKIFGLSCSDVSYGEEPKPFADTDFGDIVYSYSNSESGPYGEWKKTNPVGTYWVKATVEEGVNWTKAESSPVKFSVTEKDGISIKTHPRTDLEYNGCDQSLGYIETEPSDCSIEYYVNGTRVTGMPYAKEAGSYTVGYTASMDGYKSVTGSFTSNIEKATPDLTLDKYSANYTVPKSDTFTFSYNGDGEISVTSSNENVASATIDQSTVTVTPMSGGTATITVNAAEGKNFSAAKAQHSATVNTGTITVEKHSAENLTYTGFSQKLGYVTADPSDCIIEYRVGEGAYSPAEPYATNAGTHTVGYRVSKTGYKTIDETFEVTIAKANVLVPDPVGGLVYNRNEQIGVESSQDYKYTLTNNKATDASDYIAVAHLVDGENYEWNLSPSTSKDQNISWSIAKATPHITGLSCSDVSYGEEPHPIAYTDFGEIAYSYSNSESGDYGKWSTDNEPGTYWVKATVDKDDNWIEASSSPVPFTVNEKSIIVTPHPAKGLVYTGSDQSLGFVETDPLGCSIEYTLDDKSGADEPTAIDASSYNIKYTIKKTGYSDVIGSFNTKIDKAKPKITDLTCEDVDYGYEPRPTATSDFGEIAYSYSDSESGRYGEWSTDNEPGTYWVKATVEEDDNWTKAVSIPISFHVNAKNIKVIPHPAEGLVYTGSDQSLGFVETEPSDCNIDYSVDNINASEEPKATNAGMYTVGYVVSKEGYKTVADFFSVGIDKAQPEINDLSCEDVDFGEIPNPSATSDFGEIVYSYSDSESGDYREWSTDNEPGTYWVKASVIESDNWTKAESSPISFTVNAKDIIVTSYPASDLVYSGSEQTLGYVETEPSGCIIKYAVNGVSVAGDPLAINAGQYTVSYTVEKIGYNSATGIFNSVICKAKVDVPSAKADLLYNGRIQEGVDQPQQAPYSLEGNTAIDAGSYTAIASLNDQDNFEWNLEEPTIDAQYIDWSIAKRSLILTSDGASRQYNGEALMSENVNASGDGFADGDEVEFKNFGKRVEVGVSTNHFDVVWGDVYSENYNTSCIFGPLEVTCDPDSFAIIDTDALVKIMDKYQFENPGDNVDVEMKVSKQSVKAEDIEKIQDAVGDKKLDSVDATLKVKLNDVEQLDAGSTNEIIVKIVYKYDYINKADFQTLRVHDGQVAELTQDPNENNEFVEYNTHEGRVNVYAEKYSTYSIAYNGSVSPSPTPSPSSDISSQDATAINVLGYSSNTGDSTLVFAFALVVLFALTFGVSALNRRKQIYK